jgi:hypothetical protein
MAGIPTQKGKKFRKRKKYSGEEEAKARKSHGVAHHLIRIGRVPRSSAISLVTCA